MGWFSYGFPGVVSATVQPTTGLSRSVYVQFFREQTFAADSGYRMHANTHLLKGDSADISDLVRGNTVTIAGTEYQAVTDAEDDGHGVCTLQLEPLP